MSRISRSAASIIAATVFVGIILLAPVRISYTLPEGDALCGGTAFDTSGQCTVPTISEVKWGWVLGNRQFNGDVGINGGVARVQIFDLMGDIAVAGIVGGLTYWALTRRHGR
jgi:hypothetical protein